MAYIGVSPSNGVRQKHTYTATASQTSFSGAGAEGISLSYLDSNYVDVYQNGVKLSEADYTATTGTTVVLATGATVSDMIEIIVYDVFSVADTVSKADGGTFDGNVTMAGTITVTGNADLNGDLDVDGTTNLDAVDVDGAVNFAADVTFADGADIITASAGTSNFRAGVNAGNSITSGGNYNTVVGDEAGTALTTGDNNVAIGYKALKTEDAHGTNVAVGTEALETLNAGGEGYNVAVGYKASEAETTGIENTMVGAFAGGLGTTASRAVGLGYSALYRQNPDSLTATYNIAIGYNTGSNVTTGHENTLIGGLAGDALNTGSNNVAVGYQALSTEDGHGDNTAVGYRALLTQNVGNDGYNTAVGSNAGKDITTGRKNTLMGSYVGDVLTDADNNTAVGYAALSTDTLGSRSTAVGNGALGNQNFTSATNSNNTAVGYSAGSAIQTSTSCTLVGESAGLVNVASFNTFVGANAGEAITSGEKNTIVGRYTGNQNSLDIRTSDNNIVLSDGDGNPRGYYKSSVNRWIFESDSASDLAFSFHNTNATNPYGAIIKTTASADNDGNEYFLACNDSSANRFIVLNNGNVQNTNNSYGAISDVKLKEQITDASSQWEDIKALTVRKYKMKEEVSAKGDSDNLWRLGVVAQEVETAGMNGLISESIDRDEEMNDLGTTTKTVKYSILYMKAVKALQEAMTRIETLEAKVTALEGE